MIYVRGWHIRHKTSLYIGNNFVKINVELWTDFNQSFILAFSGEMRKKLEYILPPRLKSVAALPCEI